MQLALRAHRAPLTRRYSDLHFTAEAFSVTALLLCFALLLDVVLRCLDWGAPFARRYPALASTIRAYRRACAAA